MVQCSHQYERSAPVFGTIHSLGQVSPEIRHTANPSRICGTPSACPAQVGRFFCLRRSRQAARRCKTRERVFCFPWETKGASVFPITQHKPRPPAYAGGRGFNLSFFSSSARTANSRPPGYQSPPPARWRCTATCRTGNRSPDSCCSPPPTGSSPPGGSGHSGNIPAGG